MNYKFIFVLIFLTACRQDQKTIKPVIQNITESVYGSGLVKSKNQYDVFSTVSGIVTDVFVDEGSTVEIGSPLLFIANDAQQLMAANSALANELNSLPVNQSKLEEAKLQVDLTKSQWKVDSTMLERQKKLWAANIGNRVALEERELAYQRSAVNYQSAIEKFAELKRQLNYLSQQAQNNLLISKKTTSDYLLRSKVNGKVYQINPVKGEMVTPQIQIATIGDDKHYILEMQVDEYDIVAIRLGMPVLVVLNSYQDSVFNAAVTKINPIMNLQSKTFTIEAEFIKAPPVLYPNISFEANVVIRTKKDALLIPRSYLLSDSLVVNKAGKRLVVKTGLKDYQMVEIISGITVNDELILPEQ